MNIFYFNYNQKECCVEYVDKHCVKMILEYAQILSTVHRVVDGINEIRLTVKGRKLSYWKLPDERETILYKATHVNHPSVIWARSNSSNYLWLFELFHNLCSEYTFRYGKQHKCSMLFETLKQLPIKIQVGDFYEPPKVMPDIHKLDDTILAYRNYYNNEKQKIFNWKNRQIPSWIILK